MKLVRAHAKPFVCPRRKVSLTRLVGAPIMADEARVRQNGLTADEDYDEDYDKDYGYRPPEKIARWTRYQSPHEPE